MEMIDGKIPLPLVAQRLKVAYDVAIKLVLTGQLDGEKVGTRWLVTAASLDEFQRNHVLQRSPVV